MSQDVRWCWADDDVEEVSELMGEAQIRRVPVINAEKQLVGVVSLGDLSTKHAPGAAETLEEVSTHPRRTGAGKGTEADQPRP